MSDDARPWWASAEAGRPVTDDPVEAHRAARRGSATGTGAPPRSDGHGGSDAPGGAQGPHGSGAAGGAHAGEPSSHADAICGVCPICVLARTLGDTHPELLGHLTEAARHLAAAARTMLDPSTPPDPGPEGVQRIDLD